MEMALGNDNALRQLHFAGRPDELAGAGAGHVAALPHRSVNAQRTGVRAGDLHLVGLAHRPQNGHIGHFLLRPHQSDPLIAGELAGIGQILSLGELIAGAKQLFNSFLRQMNVAG